MVWWEMAFSFLAGAVLGIFFFGGLWWTVRRLPESRCPALLAMLSLLIRAAALLGAFYLIISVSAFGGTGWPRVVAALAAFILVRILMVARLGPRRRRRAAAAAIAGGPPPPEEEDRKR